MLRDLGDTLAVFANGSSPKCQALAATPACELAIWFPSSQRQWRLRGELTPCPQAVIRSHWPRRPRISQVMDHVYETFLPQSGELTDPQALRQAVERMDAELPAEPAPPDLARALQFNLHGAELLILQQPPALHERFGFRPVAEGWESYSLVP